MRRFFADSPTQTLEATTAVDADFDASNAETVTLESPWNDFFGTDEYVEFRATVAQPIKQPYFYDGELRVFKKSEAELKRAQAQIENLYWTMGHPDQNRVTNADQIRGFWTSPHYDDGQHAKLRVPANDTDAVRFAVQNDNVSVGFGGDLDWTDEADGYDAVQRQMAYDHIASVEQGRCSPEDGCQLHADNDGPVHGTVSPLNEEIVEDTSSTDELAGDSILSKTSNDAVRTTKTGEDEYTESSDDMNPSYSEGDWVKWEWSGGMGYGRVKSVHTDGPVSANDITRNPSEKGEPAYKIDHWDEDAGEFGNTKLAYDSNLKDANDPRNSGDSTHEDSSHSNGDWVSFKRPDDDERRFGRVSSVDSGRALVTEYNLDAHTLADEPMMVGESALSPWAGPYTDSCDVATSQSEGAATSAAGAADDGECSCGCHVDGEIMDVISYDGLMGGELDKSEIPSEGYENHYVFDGDTKTASSFPLVDADGNLRRGNVDAAWETYGHADDEELLLKVLAQANKRFANANGYSAPLSEDSLTEAMTDSVSDDDPEYMNIHEFIDENGLSTEEVIDKLNIDVPESPNDFYDSEPSVDNLRDDFTAVESLADSKESLETEVEQLNDELQQHRVEEFRDRAERLCELVDRDIDDLVERFNDDELTIEEVNDKISVAEDAIGTEPTTIGGGDDGGESEDGLVADNNGAVNETDIDRTQGGRFNLSSHDV